MKKSILFVLTIVLLTLFFVQTGLAADAEYKIRFSIGLPEVNLWVNSLKLGLILLKQRPMEELIWKFIIVDNYIVMSR